MNISESEWLGSFPVVGEGSAVVTPRTVADHPYSISVACQEIDELRQQNERWAKDYQLLAEQADELRESRERLRIRVCELEGRIEMQFDELRQANSEIAALKVERDNLRAKANYPRTGW